MLYYCLFESEILTCGTSSLSSISSSRTEPATYNKVKIITYFKPRADSSRADKSTEVSYSNAFRLEIIYKVYKAKSLYTTV